MHSDTGQEAKAQLMRGLEGQAQESELNSAGPVDFKQSNVITVFTV